MADVNQKSFTLGRQGALKDFELKDKIRRDRQQIVLKCDPHSLASDDLLVTNSLDANFTNQNTVSTLPNNQLSTRYYQENYRLINISSRQRQKYTSRPVIPEDRDTFPNKKIWDEFFDHETGLFGGGDLDLCCLALNQVLASNSDRILEFGQEFPYFFQKENELHLQVPEDLDPNQYKITLRPARRHIRSIRLVSVEPPRFLDVINNQNNLVLIDVIEPCTGESLPRIPDPDLPFSMFLIPLGSYTIPTLLDAIVKGMNSVVERCNPFLYLFDENTGEVTFKTENSNWKFHMKFWFSTTFPQFNLWEMLGFEFPYPRDEENQPVYVNEFSNLISEPSRLAPELSNMRPFSFPSLDILDYIYLVVDGFDVIQDPQVIDADLFAKVLVREDRFISSSKIFTEPLDRLESIRVRWLDPFGNLLDVKGQENSFLIELVEYQDRLKDADYSSQRGVRNFDEIERVQHKNVVSIT